MNAINRCFAILFLIFVITLFGSMKPMKKDNPPKIAVSKSMPNYINWLKKGDSTCTLINMYELDLKAALESLEGCSGLLVTGGEDVQPEIYGKGTERNRCKELDPRRDTLEIALIKKAIEMKIPVLGICRGEQIINVALGGNLIIDIPTDVKGNVAHQCKDYLNCYHKVSGLKGTLLNQMMMADSGFVTSNHHQAIDRLAAGLKMSTFSDDRIIESIEWEQPKGKSWL
ncbi:MAG: gamma-glutamyl-gamma-aminobutyrate hydrolase family protein, partial [Bacteroidota bacterium]